MNGLIGLISLSALLLAVSGQLSNLSPSYSYQGTIVATGTVAFTGTISVAVDIGKGLGYERATTTMIGQGPITIVGVVSTNDNAGYTSVDGTCTESTIPSGSPPLDSNVWDLYGNGIETLPGTITYTYTQSGTINQLVTVNGVPTVISFTNTAEAEAEAITITNFDNAIPAFSTFSLPSECSQFNCTACYSSAVSLSISVLLLLTTLLTYLFATH